MPYTPKTKDKDMTLAAKIEKIQTQSQQAWGMAVETAGPEYAGGSAAASEAMQELSDACDEAYDAAIQALEDGDFAAAREQLEQAKHLEGQAGDGSHAVSALEALDAATADARDLAVDLYRDDLRRANEVPVATDGHKAYDGWMRASSDAGDTETRAALESVDRDKFAAAWEAYRDALAEREEIEAENDAEAEINKASLSGL